jgi:SAM-dependent methyltransferase
VPSIAENLDFWEVEYDWGQRGDAWSGPWGDASAQWYGSILPRVRHFLPAQSVLEIAPGFGRWTQFLLDYCDELIGVDLAPKCVDACRRRFANHQNATFDANDGQSLPMVRDSSIDFAFSYDSLVHVESETLDGYLSELARVLKPEGVAFLHHSNYGTYQRSAHRLEPLQGVFDRLPSVVRAGLIRTGTYRGSHMRAKSVTAAGFTEQCREVGLRCVAQELVNWEGGVLLLDCFSVVARPGSSWDRPNRLVKNRLFRVDARAIRRSDVAYRR